MQIAVKSSTVELYWSTLNSTVDSVREIHRNLHIILVIRHSDTTNYDMWLLNDIWVEQKFDLETCAEPWNSSFNSNQRNNKGNVAMDRTGKRFTFPCLVGFGLQIDPGNGSFCFCISKVKLRAMAYRGGFSLKVDNHLNILKSKCLLDIILFTRGKYLLYRPTVMWL